RLSTTLAWLPPLLIPTACAPPMPPGTSALFLRRPRRRRCPRLIPHHPAHQRTSRRPLLPPLKSIFPGPSPPTTSASPAIEWHAARGLAARTSRKSPRRQPPPSIT